MQTIKNLLINASIFALTITHASAQQSDSTGLPGDNFSLQGALDLFEKAQNPEAFEKAINLQQNNVNNLDLDADGHVDYIQVIEKAEADAHIFVLRVAVSETESQDVAVIEIEKTGEANAVLQIVGDEELYGEEIILEPDATSEAAAFEPFPSVLIGGPNVGSAFNPESVIVNVWFWPTVRIIYAPAYRPWASPWRWHRYPSTWQTWRPYSWHTWHPRRHRYGRPVIVVHTHRAVGARNLYTTGRVSSVTVRNRNAVALNNYRVSRTTTTVTGPRGNTTVRKTTTVRGPQGKVRGRRATVRRRG